MKKIDAFCHIWTGKFYERLKKITGTMMDITMRSEKVPMITDLDVRFKIMDMFEDYQQVPTLASPPLELVADPEVAIEVSKIGNDDLADLCDKYPERFPGFVGIAPMNAPEEAVKEIERLLELPGALGVLVYSNVKGVALDHPQFEPFWDIMSKKDKPVWIHPARGTEMADYKTESESEYEIWWSLGWPYETAVAMSRIVFSRILDRYPDLKIITHHGGGMIPFVEGRVGAGWDQLGTRTSHKDYKTLLKELKHRPYDYFRMFYADTATFGSLGALQCALGFYGADHMVFASDSPFDPEGGPMYIRETIKVIERLEITEEEKIRIYHGNLERITGVKFT